MIRWLLMLFALVGRTEVRFEPLASGPHALAPIREVTVDGKLDDWDFAGALVVDTTTGWESPPGTADAADSSARVQLAWNGRDVLYLAAAVRDQSLVPRANAKAKPWDCDSLMLSMTTWGATRDNPRFTQNRTSETAPEPFFGFSVHRDVPPPVWTPNSRYVIAPTADGYAVEAAVSLADLGYGVLPGDQVKMGFILSDHDADGSFTQILCGHARHGTPAAWYDLRFLGREPIAGELAPVATADSLAYTGQIDVLADATATAFEVHDAAGQIVAREAVDQPLAAGTRLAVAGEFAPLPLAPGAYRLTLVAGDAGAVVRTPVIVKTGAEAAGRLPDRYIVPDPTRFAFPSDRRHYEERHITRQDYLDLIKRVMDKESFVYAKGREANAGRHGISYAAPAYLYYRATGERQYLDVTLGLLQKTHAAHAEGDMAVPYPWYYHFVELVRNDPGVGEEDRAWLGEFMPRLIRQQWQAAKPTEWGAFNRAVIWGAMLDIGAMLMPDHPDVAKWRQYADLEWESWWPYRDHDENSSDYNAASIGDYLDWAEFRDPEYLDDPGFAVWFERYMYQVTPSGGMPGYGDAGPWNESCWYWLAAFERMATITGDGRFKWAAHRLFDYATRQIEDLFSYHSVTDSAARNCAWAAFWTDEAVAPVAPQQVSRITRRKKVEPVDEAFREEMFDKYGITGLFYRLRDEWQPDKLILRAGSDPFAPAAMVELCSDAGHHMSTVPNLNSFMHQRAVLLLDLGYYEKGPEYHNVVFIEDLTGMAAATAAEVVTVRDFAVGGTGTCATIAVDNYKGWPVENERQLLFTVDGPLLVKDLVRFHQPFVARVRQQWQTRNVAPQGGDHWVNVQIPWMLNSGLGLGRGVSRWKNPNWDLLVYWTPQPDRDYEVFDRSLENIWQAVPVRVSQRWRGLPETDNPLHFTTLLWPHKPVMEVEEYVRRVTVLADSPAFTAMRVDLDERESRLLVLNGSREVQEAGELATDAVAMELRLTGDRPSYVFAHGATRVRYGDALLFESDEPADVSKSL